MCFHIFVRLLKYFLSKPACYFLCTIRITINLEIHKFSPLTQRLKMTMKQHKQQPYKAILEKNITSPANTSTLKRRWLSTFINVVSKLIFGWKWANVHLWTLFQCWQNNTKRASIELHPFNDDEPTLFQRWNLVENESWADVCLWTLFQRWDNNVETTMKDLCQFNVDDPMLFQRWYLSENESWVNVCSSALPQP